MTKDLRQLINKLKTTTLDQTGYRYSENSQGREIRQINYTILKYEPYLAQTKFTDYINRPTTRDNNGLIVSIIMYMTTGIMMYSGERDRASLHTTIFDFLNSKHIYLMTRHLNYLNILRAVDFKNMTFTQQRRCMVAIRLMAYKDDRLNDLNYLLATDVIYRRADEIWDPRDATSINKVSADYAVVVLDRMIANGKNSLGIGNTNRDSVRDEVNKWYSFDFNQGQSDSNSQYIDNLSAITKFKNERQIPGVGFAGRDGNVLLMMGFV